jgi:hypothetical protein
MASDQSVVRVSVRVKGEVFTAFKRTCDDRTTIPTSNRRAWQIGKRHWVAKREHHWANTSGGVFLETINPPGGIVKNLKKPAYW